MILKVCAEDEKLVHDIINTELSSNKEKYKYFIGSSKLKPLKNSQFEKIEYISHVDGKIQGYFAYILDKFNNKITNIELMAFENSPILVRDFIEYLKILDKCYKHIELAVIPGNPAYRIAKKYFEKYKFIKIGTLTESVKLIDGNRYDIELWQKRG